MVNSQLQLFPGMEEIMKKQKSIPPKIIYPDGTPIEKFISFSGGVESTELWRRYGKGAKAIVSDTGDEEDEMYERWDFVENAMKIIHDGDTELIRVKPLVNAKGIECQSLDELALAWGFWPSSGARWCTIKLKIEPIDNFLATRGRCELMIGLNADEIFDREGNQSILPNVIYTTPLADDGVTRGDCIENLTEVGLQPNFPPYMKRGGCRKCFFRGKSEAKAKYLFNKQGFLKDQAFEVLINETGTRQITKAGRKKWFGINQAFSSYQSIIDEVESEITLFGREEVINQYKNITEHKACGLFCHR
jgi:3'-phosphoadenosine 5'-phosphosulfate sulfotransferase (PAPS reductase)/FAD synthetase